MYSPAQGIKAEQPHYIINAGGGLVSVGNQNLTYSIGNSIGSHVLRTPKVTEDIIVYPNPVQQIVQVSSTIEIHHIEIMNLQGILIAEYVLNNNEINLGSIASGQYLMLFYSSNGELSATRQILKY